jgi:signal transduction histidine kinase
LYADGRDTVVTLLCRCYVGSAILAGMTISRLWGKLRHPQTTARWRLTLLYGGMFLVCGAALLAVTYALVSHQITGGSGIENPPSPARASGGTNTPFIPPLPRGGVNPELPPPSLTTPPNVPAAVVRVLRSSAGQEFLRLVETQQQVHELNQLEIESAIALGIMTVVSGLLGWVVAGRVLRPVRRITATTQEISETNLHRRLDLAGPRDEFGMLAETIDSLLARLEAAFESQRRFVANASHELRTPLTTMRAALDVSIAKPHPSSDTRSLEASLREDLDQADRLLESFLVLARAQRRQLDETLVSLSHVVRDALNRQDEAIAVKQIELHSSLAPVCVEGSETLLERMVENLLDNAVRHNLPHGSVSVSCEADRETARLVVESDGSLLDQEAVGQLAQPFRRLGTERTGSQNGHGLGLSIVAAVAAAHGGELTLYAREQGGLGAEIALPVAHAHATATSA